MQETEAAKAKPLASSLFQPAAASNAHGWTHQAKVMGSGLYRVELNQGHFYRFSSSNEWSFNLTVYDAAGYQIYAGLNEPDRMGTLGQLSHALLAARDGAVFVKVEVAGGAQSSLVDLVIETTAATRGGDAPSTIDLARFGQGAQAATAEAAFFGGPGGNRITGKPMAANTIYGGSGDDVIELRTASNKISLVDGGLARDTLIVGFTSGQAKLARVNAYGPFRMIMGPKDSRPDAHALTGNSDGSTLLLRSIERIQFSDKTVEMKDLPGY